jgi:hypothetical protein
VRRMSCSEGKRDVASSGCPSGRTGGVRGQRFRGCCRSCTTCPVPDTVSAVGPGEPQSVAASGRSEWIGGNGGTEVTADMPASLVCALTAYHFDWERPLGIAPFQAWRAGLLFVGIGRLKINEVRTGPRAEARSSVVAAGSASASAEESLQALERSEIQARLVLGTSGLDIRGRVRVWRSGDLLRVDGTVPSGVPYHAARAELAALPHVRVDLRRPTERPLDGERDRRATPRALARWAEGTRAAESPRDAFVPS